MEFLKNNHINKKQKRQEKRSAPDPEILRFTPPGLDVKNGIWY
jgi:hypothetical protein